MAATDRAPTEIGEAGAEEGIAERVLAVMNGAKAVAGPSSPDAAPITDADPSRGFPGVVCSAIGRRPGETASVPFRVTNSDQQDHSVHLASSDLVSAAGDLIDANSVSFDPQSLTIPAMGSSLAGARVSVPTGVPPGQYAGLLGTREGNAVPTLLVVKVA